MPRKRLKVFGAVGSKRLLMVEMIVTLTNATASLYFVFQHSIGLSQAQINVIQAIFTLVLLVFTFPSGWVADRLSRRWSNAGGDFTVCASFIGLAFVNSFTGILIAEIVQGLGHAFSKGADGAMLKSLTNETTKVSEGEDADLEKEQKKNFLHARSIIQRIAPWAQLIMLAIGGYFGTINYDYMFYIAAIPFFVGGILSLCIKESGVRKEMPARKPADDTLTFVRRIFEQIASFTASELKGMWHAARGIVADDAALRWIMAAHALGFKLYLPVVLVYGPLLMSVGAAMWVVVVAYILRAFAKSFGAIIVEKYRSDRPPWIRFMMPSIVLMAALGIILVYQSIPAIIVAMMMIGVCEGWFDTVTESWLYNRVSTDVERVGPNGKEIIANKDDILSSVGSMSDTAAQAIYATLLFAIAAIAGDSLQMVIVIVFVVGLVALPVTIWRMKHFLPDDI